MVVSAHLARNPNRDGRGWRILRLDGLFGITVTGIVCSSVLATIREPHGWRETAVNDVVHYISPIGMVIGWLVFGPRPRINRSVVLGALGWPILWLIYTLIRGAIWKWYPYPFLDVVTHGYTKVILNGLAVTVVLLAVAGIFWALDRRLRPSPRS